MNQRRPVLIVEDSDEDYEALMWAWQKVGLAARVVRCTDGEDALNRMFCRGKYAVLEPGDAPALVLLDLNLPRANGRSVLVAIKENTYLKTTPVLILTTSHNPLDVEACYRAGANSYIVKPLNMSKLREILPKIVDYWMEVVQLPAVTVGPAD